MVHVSIRRTLVAQTKSTSQFFRRLSTSPIPTAVYSQHINLGGKMVEFAGYALPVQYTEGVKAEHLHTRQNASLFDVSHMGQVKVYGPERVKLLERVTVADIQRLGENGQAQLSLLTTPGGGIMDDTVITKYPDHISLVVNGACKEKDITHLQIEAKGFNVEIEHLKDHSLFALQGPKAASSLQKATSYDLSQLTFMTGVINITVADIPCTLTRCGYTGEDGFEISVDNENASSLFTALLTLTDVKPCGLGARDSLRLEAGLCLYGNDIDESTSPIEASLLWTIGKRRREEGGFIGSETILEHIKNKPNRKRIGLVVDGPPARAHTKLYDEEKQIEIGEITSGTFSPILSKPIAMGYINTSSAKVGTKVFAKVRNKMVPAIVSKMPFVPTNYYKKD